MLPKALLDGEIVYTFGTGDSHQSGEDMNYRARGLVIVSQILEPNLAGLTE